MIQVDARLYERYKQLRSKLQRQSLIGDVNPKKYQSQREDTRRECFLLHYDLFYTPPPPRIAQPLLVAHPMDKPT